MNAAATPTSITPATSAEPRRGHVGLVVLGSIAAGLAIGLLLVLGVFAGASEARVIGSALAGLGAGFVLLTVLSTRRTDQPQRWALVPGAATAVIGVGFRTRTQTISQIHTRVSFQKKGQVRRPGTEDRRTYRPLHASVSSWQLIQMMLT